MPSHLSESIPGTLLPRVSLEKEGAFRSRFVARSRTEEQDIVAIQGISTDSETGEKKFFYALWLPYRLKMKFKAICISGYGNRVFIVVLYFLTMCRNLNFYHS